MIKSLHIENYALIEELDIELHKSFSVITGETGAGKSIILGAIGLLLGQRADTRSIKDGAKRCIIEAKFDIAEYGLADFFETNDIDYDEGECIVRRELTSSGKSRAFINDTPVQLTLLKELGEKLIDVHSQHQNLLLNREDFQLKVLDTIAGNADELKTYKSLFNQYTKVSRELEQAITDSIRNKEEEDYLRFQANQIAEAKLSAGEQEELEKESEILDHTEEIKEALYKSHEMLSSDNGCAMQLIKDTISSLNSISNVYPEASQLAERLESCRIEIKDVADEIEAGQDSLEYDPERQAYVNERLNTIYSLLKKHNVQSVEELLDISERINDKLSAIDNDEELIGELQKKKDKLYVSLNQHADKLSDKRRKAAEEVETKMCSLLIPLGMPNVRFKVELNQTQEPEASGKDKPAFMFSANRNSSLQNLAQVASGGEIARVMLSLKALIADVSKLPTIIFDEIDTGVSGSIAEKMARIMKDMGTNGRQVISITHLPQIAAMADIHYKVFKTDDGVSTQSHIVRLTDEQRIEELAHMLSGEVLTDAARKNAGELLANAQKN